jgi:hypothetical protein
MRLDSSLVAREIACTSPTSTGSKSRLPVGEIAQPGAVQEFVEVLLVGRHTHFRYW